MDSKVGRAVNEVIDAMVERRSCRSFTAEMPSEEQLDAVVEAGLYAASGMGRQSAIILKVTDRALRDRLSALNARAMGAPESTDPFYGAPVVLVVLAARGVPTHVYDGSLAMGNMLLAADPWAWAASGFTAPVRSLTPRRAAPSWPSWASRATTRASATAP